MSWKGRIQAGALGLFCFSPQAAAFLWAVKNHLEPRTLVVLALVTAMLSLLIAAAARTWRTFFLVQFPLVLLGAGFMGYAFAFGRLPGETLAMLALSASWEEIEGLLLLWGNSWLAALGAALALCYLVLALRCPRTPIFSPEVTMFARIVLVVSIPATVYAALDGAQTIDGLSVDPIIGSLLFVGTQVPTVRSDLNGSRIVKVPYHAARTGGEEVHVLVIGESSRRDSWSVYGYDRQTTPYLDRLGDEAVFLRNATADANFTLYSVPMMLTGMRPGVFDFSRIHGNLVDLAREGHYRTSWLVNQDMAISLSVGVTPDHLQVPSGPTGGLDEQLLPALRREIARGGEPRFIGLHIMGSHWEYDRRYPPPFQRFGTANGLNAFSLGSPAQSRDSRDAYDNSVLYTDWFLEQVIEAVRAVNVPATVTFMPDHGEDLFLLDAHTGHGSPGYTAHAFAIPAFVWTNEAFRRLHPQVLQALRANAGKPVRGHDIFYAMADIMGITWPGARPSESFAAASFQPDTTTPYIAGGNLVRPPP
jgi:glucan phosphoethanolaminetransferase (alkaline phosphatase superfamily)